MLKPIETTYRGCRFRSRLEARWAVFFQTLGLKWEYEPEGFQLTSGDWYLPDFRVGLVNGPTWFEVKPSGGDTRLFYQFMADLGYPDADPWPGGGILAEIPDPADIDNHDGFEVWGDDSYKFCACRYCGAFGFQWRGRSYRICCCKKNADDESGHDHSSHPRLLAAYRAARSARFEHADALPR